MSMAVATFLIDLSPSDMQRRLFEALTVYVDAMRYPRGTEDQRASMWLEHIRRRGWQAVAAVETPPDCEFESQPERLHEVPAAAILGIAYGYCGAPDQWWHQQVAQGLRRVGIAGGEISRLMSSYFELTELHIRPHAQGRGLGEAQLRRLLANRAEANVLLSTPRSTARPIGPGGCIDVWASTTSSFATITSPATRDPLRSWVDPPAVTPLVWHDDPRA